MQRKLPTIPLPMGHLTVMPYPPVPKWKKLDDPGKLDELAKTPKLPQLPNEWIAEQEKLRANGPEPKKPKPQRHLGDHREIIVSRMMDRDTANGIVQKFKPKKFDTNTLWVGRENANRIECEKLALFYGMRGTGKSFTMRYLLSTGCFLFDYGMVLTYTKFNRYWQKYFPDDYVQEFDPIILKMLLAEQAKEVDAWERAGRPRHKPIFKVIVLDDVVGRDTRWIKEIDEFATRGRHFQICVFFATQYPRLLSTVTRGNCDLAFIFFQQSTIEMDAIWESYFSHMTPLAAEELVNKHTVIAEGKPQRDILCVNNMPKTHDLSRKVWLLQPKDPGDFVVGSPRFWKNDKRYQDLLEKGAFERWFQYRDYLLQNVEGHQDPMEAGVS